MRAGDAEVAGAVAAVAGEVAVVAAGDVLAAAAGDVLAAAAGEVFAAAAGELCPELNPAGRAARRAIARMDLSFMETESFYLMRFKEARPKMWGPVRPSDIGATRADSYVETRVCGVTFSSVND